MSVHTHSSPSRKAQVRWPAVAPVHPNYTNAVQCDWCQAWYHFCCVGLGADAVLPDDAPFECPPCAGDALAMPRPADVEGDRYCARPDCPLAGRPLGVDEFFVERIIGRRPAPEPKFEGECQYYIKWEGYDINDATWEDAETLPRREIDEFEKQAAREGANVADADDIVLLNEVHIYSARALKTRHAAH
ncbi:hypothetical protein AURDEDRAFT_159602 [Auricularia subglabra TFB-10046 SS5]|nr:hypothetical protein AURDEDRAFT_159602 [Auricularia subglabra TFB-10046 SS5]